jgi:excinuclease ABC subunit C
VVFEDGLPRKSEYRRFEIRSVEGQDDVASLREVLTRRLARLASERNEPEEDGQRKKFAYPPNLIVVDGGRPQLAAALEAVRASASPDLAVVSLAKRMEEVYLPGSPDPVVVPRTSEALYLLQRVRDEAHRFAITYHRKLRERSMTRSVLDGIPGVGETRRRQLVRHFGSARKAAQASLEELEQVPGVGPQLAKVVYDHLHGAAAGGPGGSRNEAIAPGRTGG